jgi:hypothetical protein
MPQNLCHDGFNRRLEDYFGNIREQLGNDSRRELFASAMGISSAVGLRASRQS